MRRVALPAMALFLAGNLALTSCLVGPGYRRPEYPVPTTFRGEALASATVGSFGDLEWWRVFEDESLIELIRGALVENYDLRVAVARIFDARAQLAIARSFLFPTIGAGANVSYTRPFGISPAVMVPVFTAGRVQGGVDSAEARTQAAILRYQQTIQQAFREVSDSLVGYERNRQFRIEKEYLVITLRDAVRLANIRYQGGVSSYLEVLDTEIRLFDAELTRVLASLNERVAVVQLYKALGGGWQPPKRGPGGADLAQDALTWGATSRVASRRPARLAATHPTSGVSVCRRLTCCRRGDRMSWVYLVLAGLFEIGWPVGLKLAQGSTQRTFGVALAVISMTISGALLWFAQKEISLGTAYAVWTGIGAAGTFLVGVWFYGDPTSVGRYLGAALIIAGVATLKLSH